MGRLMNPGPGELVDRLSILARKIEERPGEGGKHWAEEASAVAKGLGDLTGGWANFFRMAFALAATNARLWEMEDRLRCFRVAGFYRQDVAELAFAVQAANDRRDGLIREINQLFGGSAAPEKVRG